MSDLQDHLLGEYDELIDTDEKRESFKGITDQGMAGWAARNYRWHIEQEAEIKAQADAEIARISEWAEANKKRHHREAEWFGKELESYATKQRNASPLGKDGQPKLKTVPIVGGKIATRQVPATAQITDKEQLIKWLNNNDWSSLVKSTTTETVSVTDIKDNFNLDDGEFVTTSDGEVVTGVQVKPGYLSFKIEAADE